jgi:hypothetical protein
MTDCVRGLLRCEVLNISEESKQWVKEKQDSLKPGEGGAYPPALEEVLF